MLAAPRARGLAQPKGRHPGGRGWGEAEVPRRQLTSLRDKASFFGARRSDAGKGRFLPGVPRPPGTAALNGLFMASKRNTPAAVLPSDGSGPGPRPPLRGPPWHVEGSPGRPEPGVHTETLRCPLCFESFPGLTGS